MPEASYDVFRYLGATEHAEAYREIMRAFAAAKQRFIVHVRPEELSGVASGVDPGALLKQLVDWGNLKADPDTSRVATVEEFNRARFVYQLTAAGESAERALSEFDRTFGAAGELQSWALDDIVDQLNAIIVQLALATPDEAKVALALTTLSDRFTGLATNAQAFSGDLQRTIDLRGVDTEAFIAYKERLIGYLQRFIQDLVTRTAEIASLLERIPATDAERALRMVAVRQARDAAPAADDAARHAEPDVLEPILGQWRDRFDGFRQWFVGSAGAVSQSQRLRHMAINAVPALLGVVQRLGEQRAGRSDRVADFRSLAVWFAEAPDDAHRHRLAAVAFGLASARHLGIEEHELDERERHPVSATTAWADAPAVEISPRLRATGSYERRGQPSRVRDRAAERRAIARAVEAQRVAADRLSAQLVADEPGTIADVELVDPAARALLLHLLGDALAQRRDPLETVTVASLDGAYRVEVEPHPDAVASLAMPDGVLTGPAHRIRIGHAR
ncbi:TIGR02677 family protein [Galbitalea sp. SE-J8]|uniref:TIGR02677 family protein n=1 Tax=Galbitalea sp. SE-J8 TaxID=3054952 RepID=UPI00259CB2FC|nr:TIGR02677 family protein [Galbitalea sp. SE-J8]MDM4764264.1 TIGR02677 family protein [Galbitalea sp. SE-J8]